MSTALPIACSLSAAEMPDRLAEVASIGRDALLSAETGGARAVLRFRANPGVRDRLAVIVAAEAQCCAFLGMELHDAVDAIELTIEAPEGAELVRDELVAVFRGRLRTA